MTGFEWDVQPYRWLDEMRNAYTETVIATTKYMMDEQAAEATQWMRQNAVWTDRDPRTRVRQDGRNHQSARKGLVAEVQYTEKETDAHTFGLNVAKNLDAHLLNKINAQRKKDSDARDKQSQEKANDKALSIAHRRGLSADEVKPVHIKSSYIPVSKLQSSESHIPAFERQFRKDFRLIGTVKFHYNKYRTYAIWLEVAHGGRFGIISRALQYWGAKMKTEIKRIANLKQFQKQLSTYNYKAASEAEKFEAFVQQTVSQERTGRGYTPFSRAAQNERARRRRGRARKAAKQAR